MSAPVSPSAFRKSEQIVEDFAVVDGTGANVTGLTDASFGRQLVLNGASSAVVVTVTEISGVSLPGLYKATFTPTSTGHWGLRLTNATYNPEGWFGSWNVEDSDLGDLNYMAVTAFATTGLTSGTLADISRALEAFDGKGRRLDWTYDGSNRVSSVTLTLSYDGFVTANKTYTISYTYGDVANTLRPTRIQWS